MRLQWNERTRKKGYWAAVRKQVFALLVVIWLIYFLRSPRFLSRVYQIETDLDPAIELLNVSGYENLALEMVVAGKVRNSSDKVVSEVNVNVVWYNSRSEIIYKGVMVIEKIPVEQEQEFRIAAPKTESMVDFKVFLTKR